MLERLVREHLPAALAFAVRLTGNADDAEDLVQEALARATRGWAGFRGEAAFKTWLFRIVLNAFRDRPRRRVAELPADLPDPRAADPARQAETTEFAALVAARVSALPPRQREALVLTAYEGMAAAEAAACMETTEGNVRVLLHQARTTLRRQLADLGVGETR